MSNTKEESAPTSDGRESQTSGGIPIDFSPVLVEMEKMIVELAELGKEMVEWSNTESRIHSRTPVTITETEETVTGDATVQGFEPEETDISLKEDILIMSGERGTGEARIVNSTYPGWKATSATASHR